VSARKSVDRVSWWLIASSAQHFLISFLLVFILLLF